HARLRHEGGALQGTRAPGPDQGPRAPERRRPAGEHPARGDRHRGLPPVAAPGGPAPCRGGGQVPAGQHRHLHARRRLARHHARRRTHLPPRIARPDHRGPRLERAGTMSGPTPLAPRPTWRSALGHVASLTLPRRSDYTGLSRSWRGDLVAGVTVGVVALPLALGFGVASGVGPAAGLITAIVAGFVAAVLGGSHLQVSGPTGAMTVVLIPVVARYGTEAVFALSILAGVMVIIMGLVGMGRLVSIIPWPVVEGLTLGIGV